MLYFNQTMSTIIKIVLFIITIVICTCSVFSTTNYVAGRVSQNININAYLNKILSRHYIANILLINYQEIDIKLNFPSVLYHHEAEPNAINRIFFDMYIIVFNKSCNITSLLESFKKYKYWNSRARFITVYPNYIREDITRDFKLFWKYFIYNLISLAYKENKHVAFTYFPYKNGDCGLKLDPEEFEKDVTNYFPEKISTNLNGCKFKIITLMRAPYCISLNYSGENPSQSGIELTLVHNIAKKLNFVPYYIYHTYPDWGYRLPNGSYIMMYKSLYDQEALMAVNGFYWNSSMYWEFDFMFINLIAKGYWWAPAARTLPVWQNLTKIFNIKLWVVIFACLVFNGFFRWVLEKRNEGILYCIFSSMCAMILIPIKYPKERALKLQLHVWIACGLIISTIYISQMINILTKPLYERQISTMDEVFENKLKFGFHPLYYHVYDPKVDKERYIRNNWVQCSGYNECVNRTAFRRDFAVMKNDRQILYWIPKIWTLPNGRKMIYPIQEYVVMNLVGYGFCCFI